MLLNRRSFIVKEKVAVLKLTDTYDLYDPESRQPIGMARDEPPGWAKYARLVVSKQLLPTSINVYEANNPRPVLSLKKAPALLRTTVEVCDTNGAVVGRFRSKLFSLGGGFYAFDPAGQQMAEIKGDWKGWNFRFLDNAGSELGTVSKKWAGLGKELFTSADTYAIALSDRGGQVPHQSALLLAAGLAIDIVFKEKN